MLKRILTIAILLLSFGNLNAEVIQVDFTAELVGAGSELVGIDNTIQGTYRYDAKPKGSERTSFGELYYTGVKELRIELLGADYEFEDGIVFYLSGDAITPDDWERSASDFFYGVGIGEVVDHDLNTALSADDSFGMLSEIRNTSLNSLWPSSAAIMDEDGRYYELSLEVIVVNGEVVTIPIKTYIDLESVFESNRHKYLSVPNIISPAIVIDLTSVFSVLDASESLTPKQISNSSDAVIKIKFAEDGSITGNSAEQISAAEYRITSLTTAVVVPEPSSGMLALFGFALMKRRVGSAVGTINCWQG